MIIINHKANILLSILLTFPIIVYTQNGYFIQDNTKNVNIKILKLFGNDSFRNFRFYKKDSLITLTPKDASEYGYNQDRVFISTDILLNDTIQRVFLEKLIDGPVSLYFFRSAGFKSYYLSRNGDILTALPRQMKKEGRKLDFRDQLSEYTTSCAKVSNAAKLVSYNKNSMKRFISSVNSCDLKYFLRARFGIFGSFNITNTILPKSFTSNYIKPLKFDRNINEAVGIFVEKPVFQNAFILHTELAISKTGLSAFSTVENKDIDFVVNLLTISMPIQIRYLIPIGDFKPYINAGSNLSYHLKNEEVLYETVHTPDLIEINTILHDKLNSDFQLGFIAGAGIDIRITGRNSFTLECRYSKLYGLAENSMMNSGLHFITSASF